MSFKKVAIFCFFSITGLHFCGCQSRNNQVHYIVPNNSRGVFIVQLDPVGGIDTDGGGRIVLNVPLEGIVKVKSLDFLTKWHSRSAQYDSGLSIQSPDTAPYDQRDILLWTLFSTSNGVYYYIGTEEDKKNVENLRIAELKAHLLPVNLGKGRAE